MDVGSDTMEDGGLFDLQMSLVTAQAEVNHYQTQSQTQQATIRQLQQEVSQVNLQRQLLQEKLRQQPQAAPSPPPVLMAATSTESTPSSTHHLGAEPPVENAAATSPRHAASSVYSPPSLAAQLCHALLSYRDSASNRHSDDLLRTVVTQYSMTLPVTPQQDASLLSYLLERSRAYATNQAHECPLHWLYHALVYTQSRLGAVPTGRRRRFRLAERAGSQEALAYPSLRSLLSLQVSPALLQETFRALATYAKTVWDEQTCWTCATNTDLKWMLRLLALPPATTFELTSTNWWSLLWPAWSRPVTTWVHAEAPLDAALRTQRLVRMDIVPIESTSTLAPTALTAALQLWSCRGTFDAGAPWMPSLVAISSDWMQWVLLPRLLASHGESSVQDLDDETMALACAMARVWQGWGPDSDWLRTQVALHSDENGETAATHAPCILELVAQLLQALAMRQRTNTVSKTSVDDAALTQALLSVWEPTASVHPHWMGGTTSQMEMASALSHLPRTDCVQACWASLPHEASV